MIIFIMHVWPRRRIFCALQHAACRAHSGAQMSLDPSETLHVTHIATCQRSSLRAAIPSIRPPIRRLMINIIYRHGIREPVTGDARPMTELRMALLVCWYYEVVML